MWAMRRMRQNDSSATKPSVLPRGLPRVSRSRAVIAAGASAPPPADLPARRASRRRTGPGRSRQRGGPVESAPTPSSRSRRACSAGVSLGSRRTVARRSRSSTRVTYAATASVGVPRRRRRALPDRVGSIAPIDRPDLGRIRLDGLGSAHPQPDKDEDRDHGEHEPESAQAHEDRRVRGRDVGGARPGAGGGGRIRLVGEQHQQEIRRTARPPPRRSAMRMARRSVPMTRPRSGAARARARTGPAAQRRSPPRRRGPRPLAAITAVPRGGRPRADFGASPRAGRNPPSCCRAMARASVPQATKTTAATSVSARKIARHGWVTAPPASARRARPGIPRRSMREQVASLTGNVAFANPRNRARPATQPPGFLRSPSRGRPPAARRVPRARGASRSRRPAA